LGLAAQRLDEGSLYLRLGVSVVIPNVKSAIAVRFDHHTAVEFAPTAETGFYSCTHRYILHLLLTGPAQPQALYSGFVIAVLIRNVVSVVYVNGTHFTSKEFWAAAVPSFDSVSYLQGIVRASAIVLPQAYTNDPAMTCCC
jgi:hypothetical protein